MSNLSENIAAIRRERGMTQEALGNIVGVSMQAVSKWENGGVPDAMLLPAIAQALNVSIDALFGRNPAQGDVEAAIAHEIHAQREKKSFPQHAFELFWAMQRAGFSRGTIDKADHYTRFQNCHSQSLSPDGVTLMQLNRDLNYAFVAPTPAGGWKDALVRKDEQTAFFSLLSQSDAFDLLLFLYTRDSNPFTLKFLEKQTGIPQKRLEELLPELIKLKLLHAQTLALDDTEEKVYTVHPNPALIPLLAFSLEMIDRPHAFSYQSSQLDALFAPRK